MNICEFADMLLSDRSAAAEIHGGPENGSIKGTVSFYELNGRMLVVADVKGLPEGKDCACRVFGFHIHNGGSCSGNAAEPFADTDGHYNPGACPHPCHAGDMPPLFGNSGEAFMAFLTERFRLSDIIGKTVLIHDMPDDFTTQPAGNSGKKIACGVIK